MENQGFPSEIYAVAQSSQANKYATHKSPDFIAGLLQIGGRRGAAAYLTL